MWGSISTFNATGDVGDAWKDRFPAERLHTDLTEHRICLGGECLPTLAKITQVVSDTAARCGAPALKFLPTLPSTDPEACRSKNLNNQRKSMTEPLERASLSQKVARQRRKVRAL